MATWPYNTSRWQRVRGAKLRRDPLCQLCPPAQLRPATEVDHFDAIDDGGDPWDWDNLASACKSCHSTKTALWDGSFGRGPIEGRRGGADPDTGLPLDAAHWWREGSLAAPRGMAPSRVPLHIVCGPSGSGKTTYALRHAGPGDTLIDLDAIRAELSGRRWYDAGAKWLEPALRRRNEMLAALSNPGATGEAWFTVSAARASERRDWARMLKPCEVIVLATPLPVCIERLQGDHRRARSWGYFGLLARRWWRDYSPRIGDTIPPDAVDTSPKNLSALAKQDRCALHARNFAGFSGGEVPQSGGRIHRKGGQ